MLNTLILMRHCCETRLCVSCPSRKLEHMCVVQICIKHHLKLHFAHLWQMKRPEIIKVYGPEFGLQQNSIVCYVMFDVIFQSLYFVTSFVPLGDSVAKTQSGT